jgi:hypothetical protein
MSVAVVIRAPRFCSGEAYSGVKICVAVRLALSPSDSSLAMPKSSSFGSPPGVIKIFEGFKSR